MPPFIWIRDRLWLVANWTCEMPGDAWLLLRPATGEEVENYLGRIDGAEVEAYYISILNDRQRSVGR